MQLPPVCEPGEAEEASPMTSQKITDPEVPYEGEDPVLLDGNSFVSEWPLELAEALTSDLTLWWDSWPKNAKDETDQKANYIRLANCVYGYYRYPKPVRLLKDPLLFSTHSTQMLLDGIYFIFRFERFQGDSISSYEPFFRQALQEVVRRVHSAHPPHFLAVARLTYSLMNGEICLGTLTPSAFHNGYVSCHFVADPAFPTIQPLFEEISLLMKNQEDFGKTDEKVAVSGLSLLREDGKKEELKQLRIRDGEASFYLGP